MSGEQGSKPETESGSNGKQWQKTWKTNRGRLLMIEGNSEDGEILLSGVDRVGNNQFVPATSKPREALA